MTNSQPTVWINNLRKSDIQEFAERGIELKLCAVDSSSPMHESDKEWLAEVFDGLLQLFGVDDSNWQDKIDASDSTFTTLIGAVGETEYDKRDVRRWARGKKLGEYVMDRAFLAVPIESDDDQTGSFNLTLELDSKTFATIRSYGEQEVYRSYIDPETGTRVEGDIEDLEERTMKGELNTDIDAVHTNISYSVAFSTELTDLFRSRKN